MEHKDRYPKGMYVRAALVLAGLGFANASCTAVAIPSPSRNQEIPDTVWVNIPNTHIHLGKISNANRIQVATNNPDVTGSVWNIAGYPLSDNIDISDLPANVETKATVTLSNCNVLLNRCKSITQVIKIIYDNVSPNAAVSAVGYENGKIWIDVGVLDNLKAEPVQRFWIDDPDIGINNTTVYPKDFAGNTTKLPVRADYNPRNEVAIHNAQFNEKTKEVVILGSIASANTIDTEKLAFTSAQQTSPIADSTQPCDPPLFNQDTFTVVCHAPQKTGFVNIDMTIIDVNGNEMVSRINVPDVPDLAPWQLVQFYTTIAASSLATGGLVFATKKLKNHVLHDTIQKDIRHFSFDAAYEKVVKLPKRERIKTKKEIEGIEILRHNILKNIKSGDQLTVANAFPKWISACGADKNAKQAVTALWIEFINMISTDVLENRQNNTSPQALKAVWDGALKQGQFPVDLFSNSDLHKRPLSQLIHYMFNEYGSFGEIRKMIKSDSTTASYFQSLEDSFSNVRILNKEALKKLDIYIKSINALQLYLQTGNTEALTSEMRNIITPEIAFAVCRETGHYVQAELLLESIEGNKQKYYKEFEIDPYIQKETNAFKAQLVPDKETLDFLKAKIQSANLPSASIRDILQLAEVFYRIAIMINTNNLQGIEHIPDQYRSDVIDKTAQFAAMKTPPDFRSLNSLLVYNFITLDTLRSLLKTNMYLESVEQTFSAIFQLEISSNSIQQANNYLKEIDPHIPLYFISDIRSRLKQYKLVVEIINGNPSPDNLLKDKKNPITVDIIHKLFAQGEQRKNYSSFEKIAIFAQFTDKELMVLFKGNTLVQTVVAALQSNVLIHSDIVGMDRAWESFQSSRLTSAPKFLKHELENRYSHVKQLIVDKIQKEENAQTMRQLLRGVIDLYKAHNIPLNSAPNDMRKLYMGENKDMLSALEKLPPQVAKRALALFIASQEMPSPYVVGCKGIKVNGTQISLPGRDPVFIYSADVDWGKNQETNWSIVKEYGKAIRFDGLRALLINKYGPDEFNTLIAIFEAVFNRAGTIASIAKYGRGPVRWAATYELEQGYDHKQFNLSMEILKYIFSSQLQRDTAFLSSGKSPLLELTKELMELLQ